MTIRKEIRDERTDVIGFYNIVKKLNDTQDGIIEVEEQFKETTLQGLTDEIKAKNESITQLQEQIVTAQNELVTLNEMLELANSLEADV